jgi:hypothetical protein
MSIRSFLDKRAERRYRRVFLARAAGANSYVVASHLRDSLPFIPSERVMASGIYACSELRSPADPVRRAVAGLGGVEFWVDDGLFVHSVYVITETRQAYLERTAFIERNKES